jgi:hypothetical protein
MLWFLYYVTLYNCYLHFPSFFLLLLTFLHLLLYSFLFTNFILVFFLILTRLNRLLLLYILDLCLFINLISVFHRSHLLCNARILGDIYALIHLKMLVCCLNVSNWRLSSCHSSWIAIEIKQCILDLISYR